MTTRSQPSEPVVRESRIWRRDARRLRFAGCGSPPAIRRLRFTACDSPAAIRRLRLGGCDSPAAIRRLRFAACDSPAAIRRLRFAACDSPAAIRRLRFAGCDSPPAIRRLRFAACDSPAAIRRLRFAGCDSPPARCPPAPSEKTVSRDDSLPVAPLWCDLGRCSLTVVTVVPKLRRTDITRRQCAGLAGAPSCFLQHTSVV